VKKDCKITLTKQILLCYGTLMVQHSQSGYQQYKTILFQNCIKMEYSSFFNFYLLTSLVVIATCIFNSKYIDKQTVCKLCLYKLDLFRSIPL